jgi:hypothetical protein
MQDRAGWHRVVKVRQRTADEPAGDGARAVSAGTTITWPPGARAQVDALDEHLLVLVPGVEHHAPAGLAEELTEAAGMLEDPGVPGWLEQVDLGAGERHRALAARDVLRHPGRALWAGLDGFGAHASSLRWCRGRFIGNRTQLFAAGLPRYAER